MNEKEYCEKYHRLTENPSQGLKNAAIETAIAELQVSMGKFRTGNGYDEGPLGEETLTIDVMIEVLRKMIQKD